MELIIYASLVLIALLSLWVLILEPKNYLFKSILIPIVITVSISTWYTYQSILGYGTEYKIKERIIYLYHLSDKRNDRIYILLIAAGETHLVIKKKCICSMICHPMCGCQKIQNKKTPAGAGVL